MNGAQLFTIIERVWRANLSPRIPAVLADQFLAETRGELIAFVDSLLAERRAKSAKETQEVDDPPELWTKAKRTKANLEALQILASKKPEELTPAERRKLLAYSGWGGLSIDDVREDIPAGLEPETFGLIHEYYTPLQIADAIAEHVCPLLPELAGHDGIVRVLEPSAGVGRFLRAMGRPQCIDPKGPVRGLEWATVELSKVSSKILTALRPDAQHFHMPFERFAREHGSQFAGRVNLVLSNPPYGERGAFAAEDRNPSYRTRVAYAYFLLRALDMLVPAGLGVFIIPGGFLTAERNRELRGRVLARHHLVAAFRLPSHRPDGREVFPGAAVVVDVLFFRARGGELTATDEADRFILDGKYFEQFPEHVLGKPVGELTPAESGDEDVKPRRAWRYQIIGEFTGLPAFTERPMCAACALREIPAEAPQRYESGVRAANESTQALDNEVVRAAVELGMRIDRYLAAVATNDADKAEGMWPELRAALVDFRGRVEIDQAGGPWSYQPLRAHAAKSVAAQQLLNAFTPKGELAPALADPPKVSRRYTGAPDDVVAQAEHLFRARRRLTAPDLLAFHREVGGKLDATTIVARLLEAKWNIDEFEDEDGPLVARGVREVRQFLIPLDAYLTGNLWPKYDRARARADRDPQAAIQAKRLMEAIGPAVFEDISDITPSQRWVPLDLVSAWISETYNRELGPIELERAAGLVRIKGSLYARTDALPGLSADTVWILGWINHDKRFFSPEEEDGFDDDEDDDASGGRRKKAELRTEKGREYSESFANWLRDNDERRRRIADAYSREFRGIITPEFSSDPLPIARWAEKGPQLKPHQVAGVRRVITLRRGLIAYDVGVGKTYTAIGAVSLARQEGWVKRPIVIVPSSLVWKWYDDFRCCLPDYRVIVIGSNRRRGVRGKNKGVLTSETDTPEERAKKWQAFQAGQADVVILSFDALARTKVNEDAVVEYAKQVEAIRREVALQQAVAADRKRKGKKLTERQEAILQHGVRAFVQGHLELPEGQRFDPGIAWDDLGADMLVVDEAAAFKNLYMPEAREAGIPKFMGGSGDGSRRAWQLDFRAAIVRKHTGGSGIVLLTATPAKNSPLEFYNLIQMIDPRAFATRLGDPEQFIDRYIRIETRQILGIDFKVEDRSAVTGFKNLDELRNIIMTYGEFRTAKEVGLKLPTPRIQLVEVDMDPYQDGKYDKYVTQIEKSLSDKSMGGGEILGLLARMSLVALHGWLDEGYRWNNALTGGESVEIVWSEDETKKTVTKKLAVPEFRAPKLVACAKRIAAQRHCGHIIFCEPTAVHAWIREVLVQEGVPRERIAILNAEVTKPADRIRIAREFNGLPAEAPQTDEGCAIRGGPDTELAPKFDVVIANSVAYEGVDLQVRTCTIHHLDLPWTPSDLEQRNGRAYRQGNRLGVLEILYYMSKRSMDGYRFGLIDGKANWLGAVLESGRRDTNNPAAQQDLSPEQILLMISRNPAETAKRVEEAKQKAIDEERLRVAREAARLMNQANARFRDARQSADPDTAVQLRAEGQVRLRQLRKYDAAAWPWARWIDEVERVEYLVPPDGEAPVFEGLRVAIPDAYNPDEIKYYEFGRLISSEGPPCIGVRASRTARWLCQNLDAVKDLKIRPEHLPGGPVPWDSEDEGHIAQALGERLEVWSRGIGHTGDLVVDWRTLGFTSASDAWLERWWPRAELRVREILSVQAEAQTVPVLVDGALRLLKGPEVRAGVLMPPTFAGWQQFLALAPASGEKFTDLKKAGELWWARKVPQTLLAAARGEEGDANGDAPAADASAESPGESAAPRGVWLDLTRSPDGRKVHATLAGADAVEWAKVHRTLLGKQWEMGDGGPRIDFNYADGIDRRIRSEVGELSVSLINWHGPSESASDSEVSAAVASEPEPPPPNDDDEPEPEPPAPRPRGDRKAVEALQKKLKIAGEFTLDGRVYTREDRKLFEENGIYRIYATAAKPGETHQPLLRLHMAPRDNELKAIDVRGELLNGFDRVSVEFDWVPLNLTAIARLSSETLAALFHLDVQPQDDAERPEPALDMGEPWERSFARRFAARFPYRLHLVRKSGVGLYLHTYAVYRENESPDEAVASIDLLFNDERETPEVQEIRWIDDGLRPGERERIRLRAEETLRVLAQREREDGELEAIPPMQLMVELLEQQTRRLREKPAPEPTTADERKGVQGLAQMLRDLAEPIRAPSEFLATLEARDRRKAAKLLGSYIAMPDMSFDKFMKELWDALVADMQVHQTGLDSRGHVVIRKDLVHETAEGRYVFSLTDRGTSNQRIERLALPMPLEENRDFLYVAHAYPFAARMTLFSNIHEGLEELGEHMRHLGQSLREAPIYLADVRRALQLAGHLIDTVGCQGETRRQTQKALAEAKSFYNVARMQLVEGRTAGALERIRLAMERIALAAVEISRTCAEGQQTMPGVETTLPVAPADRKLLDNLGGRRHEAPRAAASAATSRTSTAAAPVAMAAWDANGANAVAGATAVAVAGRGRPPARPAHARRDFLEPAEAERRTADPEILACIARLLRIDSGGLLTGQVAATKHRAALVVKRTHGAPEFPSLVNANVLSIVRGFKVGSVIGLVELDPLEITLSVGEMPRVPHILLESSLHRAVRDAYASVVSRWIRPPTDGIGPGRGAWDGADSDAIPLLKNSTCTECPYVLGSNLDCAICRAWILSLKQPGPLWSADRLHAAIKRTCPSAAVPGAALAALVKATEPPLTPAFFREFAENFARMMPDDWTDDDLDHCRASVEYQLVQPDFPLPGSEET